MGHCDDVRISLKYPHIQIQKNFHRFINFFINNAIHLLIHSLIFIVNSLSQWITKQTIQLPKLKTQVPFLIPLFPSPFPCIQFSSFYVYSLQISPPPQGTFSHHPDLEQPLTRNLFPLHLFVYIFPSNFFHHLSVSCLFLFTSIFPKVT